MLARVSRRRRRTPMQISHVRILVYNERCTHYSQPLTTIHDKGGHTLIANLNSTHLTKIAIRLRTDEFLAHLHWEGKLQEHRATLMHFYRRLRWLWTVRQLVRRTKAAVRLQRCWRRRQYARLWARRSALVALVPKVGAL